ncbi:hypothetical protein Pmani_015981 [Petrolisthes manimaculis]|uniref:Uncharacterized protein n=1 Tax=Petrolisthes manimaculis TaxID=1843537 RepID=A0AAE1PSP8_9EUCA|nr:hypothetical protein Pmani_015981 [Petrolisthes manimaculis]
MKSLLILLFVIALTRSQDEPECNCRGYIHVAEGELDVLDFPSNTASSCSAGFECAGFCGGEWTLLTNDGDLNHIMLDGITVGQHMCTKAASSGYNEINSENVYLNWNLCDGPWYFDGQISRQPLCCTSGSYSPC